MLSQKTRLKSLLNYNLKSSPLPNSMIPALHLIRFFNNTPILIIEATRSYSANHISNL